ncbi:unnamed protein product [Malus baccata var. baccata]
MQNGDYASAPYYQYPPPHQNPNPIPNPADHHHNPYASAPPFTSSDYSAYSQSYPPYSLNPDPAPPTAPSYTPSPPPISNPNLQTFNPTPQPPSSFPPFETHSPYQPPPQQQPYQPPYEYNQSAPSYATLPPSIPANPNPNSNPSSPYSSVYQSPFSQPPPSVPPVYENPYENSLKLDHGGGSGGSYLDDRYGGYNRSRSDLGPDPYGKRYDAGPDAGYGDGVYAYGGDKVEPYGARGTAPKSSSSTLFDDYGRSISVPSGKTTPVGSNKIVRAVPKADTQEDAKGGVQKFRVKLLAESGGQSTMDVLCQIGLDGIRMLDPATSRTLRIYPLDTVTRCDKTDSSTFAFWSKSSVDIEPRRIRLQSNSYTANTLLDTVTAATVQLKEMGGRIRPTESVRPSEQSTERKKGLTDWMNIIKPGNVEKDHWVPDEAVTKCTACVSDFGAFNRRHHCRNCGDIFCDKCTHGRIALTAEENAPLVRVCDRCMAEVTQRLSNAKEASSKPAGLHSHEDLAKKLQEELERNRKESSGSKSDGSGRRMREVACPTCTVHLQVQVPSSGSETIECGVCQNPFLVSAH